jgi:DNA polymerase III subunit epsilon
MQIGLPIGTVMTRVAVIDVETTGLNPYRHDRVVEIAALLTEAGGKIEREFVSLINPERDIGPTRIHGLAMRDLIPAPRFGEIAGALVESLDGCVAIAGHNVQFDHSFLAAEFKRLGYPFPDGEMLCTMRLAGGGNLICACADYGVEFKGDAHSAWHDAFATSKLLAVLLKDAPRLAATLSGLRPIRWPKIPTTSAEPWTREESHKRHFQPPSYIKRLLSRLPTHLSGDDASCAVHAYTALLDRVLEDRWIEEHEGNELLELADHWGIGGEEIQRLHFDYLERLADAALADGIVTDCERNDLEQVALLLGLGSQSIIDALNHAEARRKTICKGTDRYSAEVEKSLIGQRVCFTGECLCQLRGEPITRTIAEELATRSGLVVVESVTKRLDLLVVADPLSQSGKAKKARQYGIRIMHEPVFWRVLGVEVS